MSSATRRAAQISFIALIAGCRATPSPALGPTKFPFAVDTLREKSVRAGVVHRYIYSSTGPWAIHVLEARTDRCWALSALSPAAAAIGRQVTSALVRTAAEREEMAGGVNADFFLFTPPGVPVGLLIRDGRLIAGPIAQPALAADSAGRVHITRFETIGHVMLAGERVDLVGWNRDARAGLSLFDSGWGTATDTASGVLEVVLDGAPSYRVTMTDTTIHGVRIPANGAVLKAGRDAPEALRRILRSLTPGATIATRVSLAPFHPREAVGGRPVLVRDGVIAARLDSVGRSGFATSRHPRTAAGMSRDGSRVLLVTVDGRQAPYSDGMTLDELAALMHALGAHDALNLDGGGSTTMVIADRDSTFRVANRPSDRNGERAVGNAVGLVRRCQPNGSGT